MFEIVTIGILAWIFFLVLSIIFSISAKDDAEDEKIEEIFKKK